MPIFGRRQLQRMLEEVGPWLTLGKAKDLLKRLDNADPDQALPAEYELAVTWAVSTIASLQIDKPVGNRTPDIYSLDLLEKSPLYADVAAVDDVSLSGISTMRRARNIINLVCDQIRKQSSKHLLYTFGEESGYAPSSNGRSKYYRRRLVSRDFQMDNAFRDALATWLAIDQPGEPLLWSSAKINVAIEWKPFAHPFTNIFCTMPSLAIDVRNNPLYRALRVKSRQLRGIPPGCFSAIFVGDAGCSLLRDIQMEGGKLDSFTGRQVIQTFLHDYPSIDFVVVFSVQRDNHYSSYDPDNPRVWRSHLFTNCKDIPAIDLAKLDLLTKKLPSPFLSGYEAHSWHEQGMFRLNARGHYMSSEMSYNASTTTLRVSARAVQELMAGILSSEMFRDALFGKDNPVLAQLAGGRTVSDVRFEAKGVDRDDDYFVFEFKPDIAIAPLQLPSKLKVE